jgi:hypothetical protein
MSSVDRAQVLAVLATLSPQERAEYGIGTLPATPQSQTPKLSPVLDKIAEGDIPKVVEACRKGIRHVAENSSTAAAAQEADFAALQMLSDVAPYVGAAAQRNSQYRGKPFVHSLRQVSEYLQSPQAADKRAAAKLRVPATATSAAAVEPAGKAGAK